MHRQQPITLNARIGAITLFIGGFGIAGLSVVTPSLAPMSILCLALISFGLWSLCDEMGMSKPLVRGAMVAFVFAAIGKLQALLLLDPQQRAGFYLLYGFMALLSLMLWSAAFLHRPRKLRIIGALGALAAAVPLILLLAGHIAVGVGGAYGVTALYAMLQTSEQVDLTAIDNIDRVFALWSLAAGLTLWSGLIRNPDAQP